MNATPRNVVMNEVTINLSIVVTSMKSIIVCNLYCTLIVMVDRHAIRDKS